MTARYAFKPPTTGTNYEWGADHTFVKASAAETGGAYTLMEDNFLPSFELGMHLHRQHAETFYILEGVIDFLVDGAWIEAAAGACLHVPPGVPHGCRVRPGAAGEGARMLMIFQPAGFDQYLAELAALSPEELADPHVVDPISERYDVIELGPLPPRP